MRFLVLIALFCTGLPPRMLYAQAPVTLSGKVATDDGQSPDAAAVSLLHAADSVVAGMTLADEQGNYVFEQVNPGSYRIWVTMTGYEPARTAVVTVTGQALTLPELRLRHSGKQLEEVSITGRKAFVERKADRTVVNVDALIANAGTTALEVLERSPGVRVDQNGTISLQSKSGVVVFINDKPTYLSGTELQSYLQSLPSSMLEQIELMPNPPARYDAAGSAGVINIKTKKSRLKGFNGSLGLSYNQGKYARSNNSLTLSYRSGRMEAFANLSYNRHNSFNDLDIYRRYKYEDGSTRSYFLQHTYIRRKGDNYSGKAGATWDADEHNTVGIVLNGTANRARYANDNRSDIQDGQGRTDSVIKALNTEKSIFRNAGINLNYRHRFNKESRELATDLDYIHYTTGREQEFRNRGYLADGRQSSGDLLTGSLPATLNIYTAKADYTHPFGKGYLLSGGLKASLVRTDNLADYNYVQGNNVLPDYDKSNHFVYKENISAGYINLNKDFERLSVQAGLRLENTVSDGHQLGNAVRPDSTFRRSYTSLFPTLFLLYKTDSAASHQFSFNYGRRISRPYFQDLNPFISPLDKFTYYVGNPFLKPAFTNRLELAYTFRNRLTFTASYSDTRDDTNETIEIENGIYYSRPGNIGRSTVMGISADGTFEPFSRLRLHCYTEVSDIHSRSDFYTGRLDTRGTFWYIQPDVQFRAGKGWTLEAGGNYITDVTNAQFISGAYGLVNAGVQKTSGQATFKLSVFDMFYTAVNKGIINNLANTEATYHNLYDSRQLVLSFSYRFGKASGKERRQADTGAESEKSRVKG